MTALSLEHYNIRTPRFEQTVQFYTDVLQLRNGPFPGRNPGAWMYDTHDTPVVHIVNVDPARPELARTANESTVPRDLDSLINSGAIDHVAFQAADFEGCRQRFAARGLKFKERIAATGLRQIYIMDPNDILIELNFR